MIIATESGIQYKLLPRMAALADAKHPACTFHRGNQHVAGKLSDAEDADKHLAH